VKLSSRKSFTKLAVVWQIFVFFFINWLKQPANHQVWADLTTAPAAIFFLKVRAR
jgi:hypothetical protein